MTRRNFVVGASLAVLALSISLVLSGCATVVGTTLLQSAARSAHQKHVPKPALTGKQAFDAPKVGSCWRGTYEHVIPYADWYVPDNGGPVKCSKTHQLYTVAVLPLKGSMPATEFPNGHLATAIGQAADRACFDYVQQHVGGVDSQNGLFQYKPYVPVKTDWKAGARWVRCDLNVFRLGSTVSSPGLENLPSYATLKRELDQHPHQFDLCTNVPGGTVAAGPRATGAVFASCSGNPQWTLLRYFDDHTTSSSYPTSAQWKSLYDELCAPFGTGTGIHTIPWYPSPSAWADGTRGFECWGTSK